MPAVALAGVWIGYRPRQRFQRGTRGWLWALRDMTLDVGEGEWLGVIGGNGSGKTTLLRTIAGVYQPSKGQVRRPGRVMSVVDLNPGLARDLNGHEYLRTSAAVLGLGRGEVRRRYEGILEVAGLGGDVLDQPVYTYSAGMLLRLMLALAIRGDPAVLVVDEVLAVADLDFRNRCLGLFGQMRANGTAVVMASHDLETLRGYTQRIAVLDQGSLVLAAPPGEAIAMYSRSAGSGCSGPEGQ